MADILAIKEYEICRDIYAAYGDTITAEVRKVLLYYIELFNTYYTLKGETSIAHLNNIFFFDFPAEYGQVGQQDFKSLDELRGYISGATIRECFAMIKNITRHETPCILFELLLEYSKNPEKFKDIYPFINTSHIDFLVNMVENVMDTDILDTAACYNNTYNKVKCNDEHIPLYLKVQRQDYPPNRYVNLCGLTIPHKFGDLFQILTKDYIDNKIAKLLLSYKPKKSDTSADVKKLFTSFPFIEPLSEFEQKYLLSKGFKKEQLDNNELPYTPFKIMQGPAEPYSFYYKIKKDEEKYRASYSSGHTNIGLYAAKYFDVNIPLIILGCILWLVPYNHSISEVLSAAKHIGEFPEYKYKEPVEASINKLLAKAGLPTIFGGGRRHYRRTKNRKFGGRTRRHTTKTFSK